MRSPRPYAAAVAAALAATTLSPLVAGTARADHRVAVVTDYGFAGNAFGSRVKAEPLATGSARSAPSYLGCTRVAGRHRDNFVTEAGGGPGATLRVTGVKNASGSYQTKRTTGSRSASRIAQAVLGDPDGAHITVDGLRTRTKAFVRRASGTLEARAVYSSAGIASSGTPLDGVLNTGDATLQDLQAQILAAGGTLPLPGIGELRAGNRRELANGRRAVASASALRGTLYGPNSLPGGGDDATFVLGRARATIFDEVRSGIMHGRGVPVQGVLAGDLVRVGRINDLPLPCAGTDGEVRSSAIVESDLTDALDQFTTGALTARTYGLQRHDRSAVAWTRSTASNVVLANATDRIQIEQARGRANVVTDSRGRIKSKNMRGSDVGQVTVNGKEREAEPGDVINVPGLAKLEFFIVDKARRGLTVTAVRVSLLEGSEVDSIVDLGTARTFVKRY